MDVGLSCRPIQVYGYYAAGTRTTILSGKESPSGVQLIGPEAFATGSGLGRCAHFKPVTFRR